MKLVLLVFLTVIKNKILTVFVFIKILRISTSIYRHIGTKILSYYKHKFYFPSIILVSTFEKFYCNIILVRYTFDNKISDTYIGSETGKRKNFLTTNKIFIFCEIKMILLSNNTVVENLDENLR